MVSLTQVLGVAAFAAGSAARSTMYGQIGELTYYDAFGEGACGERLDGRKSVALSHLRFDKSLCGKWVSISANDKTVVAPVLDKCAGCGVDDIDVTEPVYLDLWDSHNGAVNALWRLL